MRTTKKKYNAIAALNDSVFCISILVKNADSEKRFSIGTGFLIADNLIASALRVQSKSEELFKYSKSSSSQLVAWKRFSSGETIGNVAMIDVNEDIFSDLTLMPGNSGAPVCDLKTGKVLGVTTSVLYLGNETVRCGIAKKSQNLTELLQKLQQ